LNAPAPPPQLSRVTARFAQKLLLLVLLAPLLNLCYFLPQWRPLFARHPLPMTAIDRAVPFQPQWVLPYASMYLLIILPPLIATTRQQLRRFVVGMAIMFVTAAVCFVCYPIVFPRPPLPDDAPWLYRAIVTLDQPINSLPSLHAGMTAYALFFAHYVLADIPRARRALLLALGYAWGAIILYATMATRQHYFADLPPGVLLAAISYWLASISLPLAASRLTPPDKSAADTPQSYPRSPRP
jgi:hypothetical protein